MKTLRMIHLYLGCVFAPMLVFFAVSGIWQTFRLQSHWSKDSRILQFLSTLHCGNRMKMGGMSLSSLPMKWFVAVMAGCLVLTIVLGVMMAFKYGRGRITLLCLFVGIAVPGVLIFLALHGMQ